MAVDTSLFDGCVRVILGSVNLLREASSTLPKNVAEYILYKACICTAVEAVEVVVRSWPHPDLSFDFMSNQFCRRHKQQSMGACISAHCYYEILSTDEYVGCIPSIFLGLFNNLYARLEESGVSTLTAVDLSRIRISDHAQVYSLCKLIGGTFPVRHCSDYIGPSDKKAFPVCKPSLSLNVSRKVLLKVNIMIGCKEIASALQESISNSVHFEVVYSGIGFSSSFLPRKVFKTLNCFSRLHVDEIVINSGLIKSSDGMKLPHLAANGTLWLDVDSALSENIYRDFLSRLPDRPRTTPIGLVVTQLDTNLSAALISQKTQISSFTLLSHQGSRYTENTGDLLGKILNSNAEELEYVQIQYALTSVPLDSLQKCTNLRVLSSIDSSLTSRYKSHVSTIQLFFALQHLHSLEFFEWSQSLNIVTKDVLALYNLLSNYLPKLLHWHWKLSHLLLFISDLNNSVFEPLETILTTLLEGKTAAPWCETYKFASDNRHFKHWLGTIRPQVCFVTMDSLNRCPPFPSWQ